MKKIDHVILNSENVKELTDGYRIDYFDLVGIVDFGKPGEYQVLILDGNKLKDCVINNGKNSCESNGGKFTVTVEFEIDAIELACKKYGSIFEQRNLEND